MVAGYCDQSRFSCQCVPIGSIRTLTYGNVGADRPTRRILTPQLRIFANNTERNGLHNCMNSDLDIISDTHDSKIGPLSLTQGHKPDHITGIAAARDGVPRSSDEGCRCPKRPAMIAIDHTITPSLSRPMLRGDGGRPEGLGANETLSLTKGRSTVPALAERRWPSEAANVVLSADENGARRSSAIGKCPAPRRSTALAA
jgi:hypothetical protein